MVKIQALLCIRFCKKLIWFGDLIRAMYFSVCSSDELHTFLISGKNKNCDIITERMINMIDYEKAYFKLFNKITDIIEELKKLQADAEEIIISSEDE